MIKKALIFLTFLVIFIPGIASAEVIRLKSGETIEGKIVTRTDEYIKIDPGIGIAVTYYLEDIDRILSEPVVPPEGQTPAVNEQNDLSPLSNETEDIKNLSNEKTSDEAKEPREEYGQALLHKVLKTTSMPKTPAPQKSPKEKIAETEFEHDVKFWTYKSLDILQKMSAAALTACLNTLRANPQFQELAKQHGEMKVILTAAGILYFLVCFPLMFIVSRNYLSGLMAWIPIVQLFLLVRLAQKPIWWVLLLFIPVVNLIIFVALWTNIARSLQKPSWLGIFMIVPGVNLILLWYFAFAK